MIIGKSWTRDTKLHQFSKFLLIMKKKSFIAECDFDGGDCCSPVVYTNVCNECKCHDTSIKGNISGPAQWMGIVDNLKDQKMFGRYLGVRVPHIMCILGIELCNLQVPEYQIGVGY